MHLAFLNAENGDQIRSLDLKTSGNYLSRIYPTHDGEFLVLTGGVLRLYSSSFEEVATKELPKRHIASNEYWVPAVHDSGRKILLEHHEYFGPTVSERREYLLLDSDTLQTIAHADGNTPDSIKVEFPRYFELHVPASFPLSNNERVFSVFRSHSLLAAEVSPRHADPLDLSRESSVRRIIVYDIASQQERCVIPITAPVFEFGAKLYAVSDDGSIAVIQGDKISYYHP